MDRMHLRRPPRNPRVDRARGNVTLEKLTIVVDAGTIVHPDGALAQVEGAALWGASLAVHEGSEFVKGRVKETYEPCTLGDSRFQVTTEPAPIALPVPATMKILQLDRQLTADGMTRHGVLHVVREPDPCQSIEDEISSTNQQITTVQNFE